MTEVARLADCRAQDIIRFLKRDGGVFIKGFLSKEQVDGLNAEIKPYLDGDTTKGGGFFPCETKKCASLPEISPAHTRHVTENELVNQAMDHFLGTTRDVCVW